jgi:YjbR
MLSRSAAPRELQVVLEMATAKDLRRLAMALDGTSESPHFDRIAFKVARIYATLAADGKSANLKLTPDEQQLKCLTAPDAFAPVDNAWGRQGWTTVTLAALDAPELEAALRIAWVHTRVKPKQKSARR